ncbi:MAG: carboxypeptidase regulatory-like domain-containing protein, partial [Methanobrevibacter sp.]|nr:carboxypeptidase regulatory-like domain-containing protein [Methanobrevibacter sp.]
GEKAINQIYVFQYIMETKDIICYFGANKKYTARIFDDNGNPVGANVNVVIRVNNKIYKVKTNSKGYISLKINFKPGTYKIKATYNGFTQTNVIIIKPVLIAKNVIVKKGQIFKFKTKLLNSKGKVVKGKKLIFKFKGNKYVAKTNKKGIASIKINLNLKVGNHKIKVLSSKSSIKRIIKVIK